MEEDFIKGDRLFEQAIKIYAEEYNIPFEVFYSQANRAVEDIITAYNPKEERGDMDGYTKSLMAKQELSTYLGGLKDALNMTKPEIKKAISIIVENEGC